VSGEIRSPGGRRLFAASVVLSALGVVLLAWWLLADTRAWWTLTAGAGAAIAGVVVAARGRRDAGASLEDEAGPVERKRGRKG
jgi:hypothetical protein